MHQFNFFPILNFIAGIWILSMGIFLFFARRRTYIHLTYFVTAAWILGYGFAHFSADQTMALFWCKFVYAAVIFIAPTMYHFVVVFWNFKDQRRYVRLSYLISVLFLYVLFYTPRFVTGVKKFSWGYHTVADPLVHFIFLFFFCLVYGKGLLNLRERYIEQKREGLVTEALRTRYFFLIYTISAMGAVDYLQDYGLVSFYPAGFVFPAIGVTVAAWAILRYRLLKVNVIIAKTIIFMIVYLTVIGIPLGAGIAGRPLLLEKFGVNWWLLPSLFLGITATIGPFFYFFLWRRAEESMKARKFKYIQVLKDFSEDVKRVRTLDELADLIVTKIKDLVGVSRVLLYIKDKDKGNFALKTYEGSDFPENGTTGQTIEKEASIIKLLRETNSSIVRGELKFGMGIRDFELSSESEKEMNRMDANLIIPFFYRDELVALIVLGEKKLPEAYEDEDIEVFNTLGTNAGLAIKTGLFVEELNIAHADVIASERFAAMGRLAASAKHEIDNPLNMIYNSLGVALSDIADTRESYSKLIKRIKPMMEEARRLSGTLPENSNELDEKLSVFDDVLLSLRRKGERDKEFKEELDRHKASILEIQTSLKKMEENILDDKVKESVVDMAHMLSTIASNLNKVKELDNILSETLDLGLRAAERIKGEVKAIYQLPKGADEDVEAIGVKSLITASFEVAKYQTYWENLSDTTKEMDIPEDLPQIKGYSDRLASVFSNLIINAYQAMTEAGIKSTEERILRITAKISDDPSFVEIHIANKGPLIPAKDLENIFDSGFSTKDDGKGLGLHICKIQVEEFNKGRIYARNIEGFGPDFVVELPIWQEETDDNAESL